MQKWGPCCPAALPQGVLRPPRTIRILVFDEADEMLKQAGSRLLAPHTPCHSPQVAFADDTVRMIKQLRAANQGARAPSYCVTGGGEFNGDQQLLAVHACGCGSWRGQQRWRKHCSLLPWQLEVVCAGGCKRTR